MGEKFYFFIRLELNAGIQGQPVVAAVAEVGSSPLFQCPQARGIKGEAPFYGDGELLEVVFKNQRLVVGTRTAQAR